MGSREGLEVIPDGIDEIDMPEWQGPINPTAKRPDDVKAFFAEHIGWVDCGSRFNIRYSLDHRNLASLF